MESKKRERLSLVVLVSITTVVLIFIFALFFTGFVFEDRNPGKADRPDEQEPVETEGTGVILELEF